MHTPAPHNEADPHSQMPVLSQGPPPEEAPATLILLHGRGGSAENMLGLYHQLGLPDVAAVAPQAANNSWYPLSFMAPVADNQPHLESALAAVEEVVRDLLARGLKSDQVALLGFSQGACLACEFIARHPRRYGAVMALTGGLVGPKNMERSYGGSLAGTPVFLGTSDPDPHVPFGRVEETKQVLSRMGAQVELRRYPGMAHTINEEELEVCEAMLQRLLVEPRQEL